ncbi:MAG: FHA domain-containing protein [Fimbriimonadaceae bacterium]
MADQDRTQMGGPPGFDPNKTRMGEGPVDPNKTVMGSVATVDATQTIKPVQCPVCMTHNPPGVMFCVECGLIFDKALPEDAFGAPAVQLPVLVDSNGREFPLRPGSNVFGRMGDQSIEDGRVSRKHAEFNLDGNAVSVKDLGSTNGTKVNGDALPEGESRNLSNKDKVSLGGVELTLSMPGEASKTQMAMGGKTSQMAAEPEQEKPVAVLTVLDDAHPLHLGSYTLGRRSSNDIAVPDPYVSGQHATIEVEETGIFLTDVGSTNGTLVNDAKLQVGQRTEIGDEDEVKLGGRIELRIKREQA